MSERLDEVIEVRFAKLANETDDSDWSEVVSGIAFPPSGAAVTGDTSAGARHRRKETGGVAARLARPRVAVALITGALVVAACAVAAVRQLPWWQSGVPVVNPKVVDRQLAPGSLEYPARADRAHARTVAEWNGATLVAVPLAKGDGYCMIPALPGSPDIGFSCEYQTADEVRAYARPGNDARWIIWGRFTATAATTIDFSDAIGTPLRVRLQPGGFFIADLPKSRWPALANAAGVAELLDASGNTLRKVCLNFGPSPTSAYAGQVATASPITASGTCVAEVPIPNAPELSKAQPLVETTLVHDFGLFKAREKIAIYQTPDAGSPFTCLFVEAVPPQPLDGHPRGNEECGPKQTNIDHPIALAYSYAASSGAYALVQGAVDPSLHASGVAVEFSDGTRTPLAFANDHFIGEARSTDAAPTASASVVVLGAGGAVVAKQKLHE